ncbi:MAG TPA: ATP-grasp domain-containing protein [Polyangiaceae bacterium]|jgi:biotin carboxylase
MKTLLLQPLPSREMPLAEWFGPDVGRDVILLGTAQVAAEYAGWAGQAIAFERYAPCTAIEYTALRLAREHRIERVVAIAECDILRGAQLRQALGLAGQTVESALAFRDKVVMKRCVSAAGIEVAEHAPMDTAFELAAFLDRVGYPVVGKPRAGSGSIGTFVLRSEDDVEALLRAVGELTGGLVEAFVTGEMLHVDGLVLRGEMPVVSVSRYVNGCLAFSRGESHMSVQLEAGDPLRARLVEFTQRVVAAMPCPEMMPFHLEVFHTPDGRLVFNEIASRVGGGRIREIVLRSSGVDLARSWIAHQLGLPPDVPPAKAAGRVYGDAVIPPRAGKIEGFARSLDLPGVLDLWVGCKEGDLLSPPEMSYAAIATILVEAESEAELTRRLAAAAAAFEASCRFQTIDAEHSG